MLQWNWSVLPWKLRWRWGTKTFVTSLTTTKWASRSSHLRSRVRSRCKNKLKQQTLNCKRFVNVALLTTEISIILLLKSQKSTHNHQNVITTPSTLIELHWIVKMTPKLILQISLNRSHRIPELRKFAKLKKCLYGKKLKKKRRELEKKRNPLDTSHRSQATTGSIIIQR